MLMQPETFAEQPPRAAAGDRVADALACDDAELRRCAIRQAVPVGDETAERQAFALLPHAREIPVLPKSQVAAQTQASGPAWRERLVPLCGSVWGLGGHERRVKPASGVCVPRGGDWPAWLCRSCSNCG